MTARVSDSWTKRRKRVRENGKRVRESSERVREKKDGMGTDLPPFIFFEGSLLF